MLIQFLFRFFCSLPADLPYGMLSLSKLKTMEFKDQIKALLITSKLFIFS